MKKIASFFLVFASLLFWACSDDSDVNIDQLDAPKDISALVTISQDNSGNVTFLPKGTGVSQYEIYFGDDSTEPALVSPGNTTEHTYAEGTYQARIVGVALNGKRTEVTQEVTVSFVQPTNLNVTITTGANLSITVQAEAELETFFEVTFGDNPAAEPVAFNQGETVSYTYAQAGSYTVTVTALSGGAATTTYTQTVVIVDIGTAPTPTQAQSSVISLFSNTYTNVPVDTWRTSWSQANLEEFQVDGDDIKKYSALNFVGIETVNNQINATGMTHFHTDIWSSDFTQFRVKLVDFGANAAFGGGDDVEHEIVIDNPARNQWVSLDIPLSSFTGLTTRAHIAQLIYVGQPAGNTTVYIDNVYFYNQGGPSNVPLVAAPNPTLPQANVISMFSGVYNNVPVDTWQTPWSQGTLTDVTIAGNAVKRYTNLNFVGVETIASQINATSMTHFHVDVWTPNMTTVRIKLVDFGANGAFQGGDDVEHELTFTPTQAGWNSYDIPLSQFTGLINRAHIAQLIFSGTPAGSGTLFVDNVYFHN
ncbi:PKD domain-containing protein [Flavobacterium sp.]|uniref:PKD domain-containing protein n=1 Tax=Flavobacterium sp. TaxID=239 RepID=UPI002631CA3C|nr:PKD domain-containing protein [Flavobacterium sp.]